MECDLINCLSRVHVPLLLCMRLCLISMVIYLIENSVDAFVVFVVHDAAKYNIQKMANRISPLKIQTNVANVAR